MPTKKWDVFISYAFEDQKIVGLLAKYLRNFGLKVWYDVFELRLGDSLSSAIDKGLAESSFGIVVISPSFIGKNWPQRELRGLVARQMIEGRKVILPIWHCVTKEQVLAFSPPLADTVAADTKRDEAEEISLKVLQAVRPDIHGKHHRNELLRMASGEALEDLKEELEEARRELARFKCPTCGALQSLEMPIGPDQEDLLIEYECGRADSESVNYLCPMNPRYPDIDQFKFIFERKVGEFFQGSVDHVPIPLRMQKLKELPREQKTYYIVRVRGKTKEARATHVEGYGGEGLSEQEALNEWLRKTWNNKVREDLRRERIELSDVDYEYKNR